MSKPLPDRRRCPRVPLRRAAKLYDPRSRRYRPAQTVNASRGGLLLELRQPLPSGRGESLELLIDWFDTGAAGRRGQLRPVTVARVEPGRADGRPPRIAVMYAADRQAAARRAA